MPGVDARERAVKNEVVFRDVNERVREIDEAQQAFGQGGTWEFLCECVHADCLEPIALTPSEYELVRSNATHFAVAPGHVDPSVERVVYESDRFVVVEKRETEQEIVRATDPRS